MVGILLDQNYAESLWGKNLYENLTRRLREKRIAFCDLHDTFPPELDGVFLIASDREWLTSVVQQCNRAGVRPIVLCNQAEQLPRCLYSCVCSDFGASMKNLLESLKLKQKTRIAVYGINTESISDTGRVDSLFSWKDEAFETMQVFTNDGSLAACFSAFAPRIAEFDAVICANDFAAISLVRALLVHAPEELSRLAIVSCSAARLSDSYREHILSLNMNYEQYGAAAVYLYETLQKHPFVSGMTVRIAWSFSDAPAADVLPFSFTLPESRDRFYKDPELSEMLIADKLLNCSDETEQAILQGLRVGRTYEQLAEDCFLTVGSIKYHVKKLLALSGAESKEQITELLNKYLA